MRKRIMTSACLVLLMGGAAYAVDDKAEQECIEKLTAMEARVDERVEANALGEGDVEEINLLLDEADAFCTEGDYQKSRARLAGVRKVLAKTEAPAETQAETQAEAPAE